jgi:hypothetical protein
MLLDMPLSCCLELKSARRLPGRRGQTAINRAVPREKDFIGWPHACEASGSSLSIQDDYRTAAIPAMSPASIT